jgi:hypothetical protein
METSTDSRLPASNVTNTEGNVRALIAQCSQTIRACQCQVDFC